LTKIHGKLHRPDTPHGTVPRAASYSSTLQTRGEHMTHSFHRWIVGLAAGAMMAGASAQAAPDADSGGQGADATGPPSTGWHEDWHQGRHHHHHHHCHGHGERGWDGDRDGGRGMGGPMGGGPWGGHALMFMHGLQLTDAQQQQIHTILSNARRNTMQSMHAGGPAAQSERLALMNPGDPGFAAAVQTAKQRAAERIQHISDLRQQLYHVLTPEQKSEVQKRVAAWKARLTEHDDGAKGPPAPAGR
jgi:Spy/CpxP family protein refolding chaperone